MVLGPRPAELDALIARRQALGIDTFDEVWRGPTTWHQRLTLLMDTSTTSSQRCSLRWLALSDWWERGHSISASPTTIGCPIVATTAACRRQLGAARPRPSVEVVSPDDETYEKFGFYAGHGVDELIVADPPPTRSPPGHRDEATYRQAQKSAVLGVTEQSLRDSIAWP